MDRVIFPDVMSVNKELRHQYERFQANAIRAALLCPANIESYIGLGGSFRKANLSDFDREFVILRLAKLSECGYEIMQHTHLAQSVGITPDILDKLLYDKGNILDSKQNALLNYVDACFFHVKASDGVFFSLKQYYADEQLATLTLLIGFYWMTAVLVENLEVPLDATPTSWTRLLS